MTILACYTRAQFSAENFVNPCRFSELGIDFAIKDTLILMVEGVA